jgi:general secretion pathway protein E
MGCITADGTGLFPGTVFTVTAVIVLSAAVAGILLVLFGRKIYAWLRKMLHRGGVENPYEDIEAMIEPARRPISSIPKITQAIEKMTGEKDFDAVRFLHAMIAQSHNLAASDLHLTPTEEGISIAMRIEGSLYDVGRLPAVLVDRVLRRIKVMARLDVYARETPQDGRISIKMKEDLDIRVALIPTIHGEKCVLRFFVTPVHLLSLGNLGFNPETLQRYTDLLLRPQGMIFLTGPTGSGKTITAYASLNTIKEKKGGKVNIVSIEDPVEFNLSFANQTQVNDRANLTFALGLKSLLRQDPNVILVGEIRDPETAEIAMQAGLTGHLILSSVHADSNAGVFARMLNMGVEPFALASASSGVLAQRLVRKLCPHCRQPAQATAAQLKKLSGLGIELREEERSFWTSAGCPRCLDLGYLGRTGIFELLVVDSEIGEAIIAKSQAQAITALSVRKGMRPLASEGLEKAREGTISLEELLAAL